MKKYLSIFFFILFFTTTSHSKIIDNIAKNLMETENISFIFSQKTGEIVEEGTCIIVFPKKMKCTYISDDGKEFYVKNNDAAIIKHKYKIKYNYRITNTPFNVILDKNLLLDKIYQVNNVTVVGDDIIAQILLTNGNDLKVIFDQNSKNLKGWETTSMDQKKVVFRINEVRLPVPGPISRIVLSFITAEFTIISNIFLSIKKFWPKLFFALINFYPKIK